MITVMPNVAIQAASAFFLLIFLIWAKFWLIFYIKKYANLRAVLVQLFRFFCTTSVIYFSQLLDVLSATFWGGLDRWLYSNGALQWFIVVQATHVEACESSLWVVWSLHSTLLVNHSVMLHSVSADMWKLCQIFILSDWNNHPNVIASVFG